MHVCMCEEDVPCVYTCVRVRMCVPRLCGGGASVSSFPHIQIHCEVGRSILTIFLTLITRKLGGGMVLNMNSNDGAVPSQKKPIL